MNNETNSNGHLVENKIFLGGACTSNWRDRLIPALDYYEVRYFNPVVKEWTSECRAIEEEEKSRNCNIHLYYFDSTMKGMYSMAEMMKSCMDIEAEGYSEYYDTFYKSKPTCRVIYIVNTDNLDECQIRSFDASYSLAKEVTRCINYLKVNEESLNDGTLIDFIREIYDKVHAYRVTSPECVGDSDEEDED